MVIVVCSSILIAIVVFGMRGENTKDSTAAEESFRLGETRETKRVKKKKKKMSKCFYKNKKIQS